MKIDKMKKGIMLTAFVAVCNIVVAHPHYHRPPAHKVRQKIIFVKKSPQKAETVIIKKANGKSVVTKTTKIVRRK